jgi:hypothetical protein
MFFLVWNWRMAGITADAPGRMDRGFIIKNGILP